MRVTTERGEEFDLTTCKVCGMWWTAARREVCPRCDLVDVVERLEKAQREARHSEGRLEEIARRAQEVTHELEMLDMDRLKVAEAR